MPIHVVVVLWRMCPRRVADKGNQSLMILYSVVIDIVTISEVDRRRGANQEREYKLNKVVCGKTEAGNRDPGAPSKNEVLVISVAAVSAEAGSKTEAGHMS